MNLGLVHWHGAEAADSFLCAIRQLRQSGVETLVMTKVDFEQLTLFWPEFYLSGPVLQPEENWLQKTLRGIFRKPKPVMKLRFSDQMLENLKVKFRDQKAIPVDGRWFSVKIWEEMCEGPIEESRQGTREDVHGH